MNKKIVRLNPTPPEPTAEAPHAQLDWLWNRFARRYLNEATRTNVLRQLTEYKKFLREEDGYDERLANDPRFYISVHWDHFALYNAEKYWRSRGYSSHTVQGRIKVLRRVMNYAARENLTSVMFFIDPRLSEPERETEQREAYNEKELTFIRKLITPAVVHARAIVRGYRRTGIGRDPRTPRGSKLHREGGSSAKIGIDIDPSLGWRNWDNMVWYFENVLNCQPSRATDNFRRKHHQFGRAASDYYGGINEVWRRLGVAPLIDLNLVVPLAIKLAWETGLNAESLYNLRRDCFQEAHPLTGLPYLHYYKERSTGEKDLHLSLFDSSGQSELHFLQKQSEIIKKTVNLILELTEPLFRAANERDKNCLLLVQVTSGASNNQFGEVQRLNPHKIYSWTSQRRSLEPEGGDIIPSAFNLSRFRPTKITQMVRDGFDFFHIQAVAGHSRVSTTIKYLATHQLADQERREVSAALNKIHENMIEAEREPKPYATRPAQHQEGIIYKGVLCDCKNVFDPPESVKRLPVYKEGQACTYWNMCLLCPNVLITRKHLPVLITYHREIVAAIEGNNLANTPNAQLYQKQIAILEGIFIDFGEEMMTWAKESADCGDYYTDTVTYRAVENA